MTLPQVPTLAVDEVLVQTPPQQSASFAHTSPNWRQKEGAAEQAPLTQYAEQHSLFAEQEFPDVLHAVFSGTQLPPVQFPPQHCAFEVQALPSETHWVELQLPLTQLPVQQSGPTLHAVPVDLHWTGMVLPPVPAPPAPPFEPPPAPVPPVDFLSLLPQEIVARARAGRRRTVARR